MMPAPILGKRSFESYFGSSVPMISSSGVVSAPSGGLTSLGNPISDMQDVEMAPPPREVIAAPPVVDPVAPVQGVYAGAPTYINSRRFQRYSAPRRGAGDTMYDHDEL